MIDTKKLENVLLELGFDDFRAGTSYIKRSVVEYDRTIAPRLSKDIYPTIAKVYGVSVGQVERCIRTAVHICFPRADEESRRKYFGATISPGRGLPSNGELIARLAVLCRAD